MKTNNLICSTSCTKISKNASRFNSSILVLLLIFFIFTDELFFLMVGLVDFIMKIFASKNCSPLSIASDRLTNVFFFEEKWIDEAPRMFSYKAGFAITLFAVILYSFDYKTASFITTSTLIASAAAHTLFNYCIGCLAFKYFKSKGN